MIRKKQKLFGNDNIIFGDMYSYTNSCSLFFYLSFFSHLIILERRIRTGCYWGFYGVR